MKTIFATTFLILCTVFILIAEEEKQALIVDAPATWEVEGGISQTMFMIGDDEGIWTGQFTGTKERWGEELSILKMLKKRG